jgi:hypothetical protein
MWESGGIAPPFFTSALDGGEWSVSRPGRSTSVEIAPGMDAMEKRKILPLPRMEPARPVRSPSLYRLSYPDSLRSHLVRIMTSSRLQ